MVNTLWMDSILDVVDYLVKPVPFSRFLKVVEKAHELLSGSVSTASAGHPLRKTTAVFVNANYSLVKINIQGIAFH